MSPPATADRPDPESRQAGSQAEGGQNAGQSRGGADAVSEAPENQSREAQTTDQQDEDAEQNEETAGDTQECTAVATNGKRRPTWIKGHSPLEFTSPW